MIKYLLSSFGVVLIFSCTPTSSLDRYSLKGTEEILSFPVIEEARMPQNSVFLFKEKGENYLSFQNLPKSEILIYSMKSQSLIKRLCLNTEGNNSVLGGFGGYYIADMEHIFIPSIYVNTIFVVDTAGVVKRKMNYSKTKGGQVLIPFMPSDKCPMVFIGNELYIPQTVNLRLGSEAIEKSPIKVVLDTIENTVEALPMRFPSLIN